jgi:hypothetical protein
MAIASLRTSAQVVCASDRQSVSATALYVIGFASTIETISFDSSPLPMRLAYTPAVYYLQVEFQAVSGMENFL